MANNLTGDYEAVLQVSVRQINGLLATLHQHGGEPPDKWPRFPHRAVGMAVGGLPKILDRGVVLYTKWLGSAVQALRGSGPSFGSSASPLEIGAQLAEKAPPGAAVRLRESLEVLEKARVEAVAPNRVRGQADVQISTPVISFVDGSTSEVTVHVYIRANYTPESGTAPLPAPIHGEVRITYQLVVNDKNALEVQVPSDVSKIRFFPTPGSGLTQAQADNEFAVHIRKAVRENFTPTTVDLGAGFKLVEFKAVGSSGNFRPPAYVDALGSGAGQALALPVQLSDAEAPAGAINSVTNLFLGTSDFAIAVSQEYVKTKFAPTLDHLRQFKKDFLIEIPVGTNPTYHLSVTNVDLKFKIGSMDLIINAKAVTGADPFPNFNNIGISQRLTLALIGQSVILQASDSDLSITGLPSEIAGYDIIGRARNVIIAERDKALPAAQAAITQAFQHTRQLLNDALVKFDPSASASYTAVEVNPDGIIVRGAIETKYHYYPEMHIDYSGDGNFWTALNCWIRGGRIDSFVWHWVEEAVYLAANWHQWSSRFEWTIPWAGKNKSATEEHRFTYLIPDELKDRPSFSKGVCLTIEGAQVMAHGNAVSVTGAEASGSCRVTSHEPILVVDPIAEAIFVALHMPDGPVGPDGVIEETITGHINILAAHPLAAGGVTTNSLIHFAGARAARPLEALNQALAQIRRRDFALTSVIVLPRGTFASSRHREVEEQLGLVQERSAGRALVTEASDATSERARQSQERFSGPLIITEDYVEGWTRCFGVAETPATYLVNARGEFVWKQEGRLDPERLAAALDEHLVPSRQRPPLPLRLAVQPGKPALDATFADDRGQVLALRRLRGKSVLLVFWQSWSAPCIRELRRLQQLHDAGGERAPVIVAVNGGEARVVIEKVRRESKLTFILVPDPDQRIARLYGVACWPTTVSINPDGVVDRIQFGAAHTHRAEDRGKPAP